MNPIIENKKLRSKKGHVSIVSLLLGLGAFYGLQAYEPQLQFIGVFILLLGLSIGSWYIIDRYILTKVSLQYGIKEHNTAMAITFVGYVILIGIAELCAFAVFFTLR